MASPDVYFDYLTEHKDVLYLTESEIATLRNLIPMFCIILGCLAAVEIARFAIVRKLRNKLLRYDSASERIAASVLLKSRIVLDEVKSQVEMMI